MSKLMNKKVLSWALYDWANSVFYTTVMAGFFPVFFKKYWNTEATVSQSTERLGIILAISGFSLALLSPFMGVLSDYRKAKKKFLGVFLVLGAVATGGLFFVPQGDWFSAALLYGFSFFCAAASVVFNDSLIVSVTTPDQYDQVSSFGFSLGYLGGGLLFLVNVLMFQKPEFFGLSSGADGVRWSFLTVSIWWLVFSIPNFLYVPEPDAAPSTETALQLFFKSARELKKTFLELFNQKNLFLFILAYWFYIDGVSTVMSMAVDFGISIGFEAKDLILSLLLVQFVGFPAAYFTGYLAGKVGSKKVIIGCLLVYVFVVVGASVMTKPEHFYMMAVLIGLAQGGVQALSRSLFAYLIPSDKAGEYFGFFNLLGKFASVLGPLLMAVTARVFGHPQKTILSLLLLFVFGIYFLTRVQVKRAAA
ncbi:permease [Bdellovibrio sp. qaytius]|nr:permease [Bdellovibrio sp. qaytius]